MRLWAARDEDGGLFLYNYEPCKNKISGRFTCSIKPNGEWSEEYELNSHLFPEITFENSPQEVEIILPQTHNKVWHDINEEPIYENGVTPIIIDSNYGHISQEGHYYNQVQWKSHIEFQKHREFRWAYEKDLMNL